jgi:hypothetical protein
MLVSLCKHHLPQSRAQAAAAICNLCAADVGMADEAITNGSIEALVSLLSADQPPMVQAPAAAALINLSSQPSYTERIVDAGALERLLELLPVVESDEIESISLSETSDSLLEPAPSLGVTSCSLQDVHSYAAGALWCIARDVEQARSKIVAVRGVERLLRLLCTTDTCWTSARAQACGALTNICRAEAGRDRLGQVGGVQVVVGLLEKEDLYTRQTAAEVLCNALSGHIQNQQLAWSDALLNKVGKDGALLSHKNDPRVAIPVVGAITNTLRSHRSKSELRKAMKGAGIKKQLKRLSEKTQDSELRRFCTQALATWKTT